MTPWKIKRRYRGRIKRILRRNLEAFVAAGFDCGQNGPEDPIFETTCDYSETWTFTIVTNAERTMNPGEIECSFEMLESELIDGEKGGVTWKIDFDGYGGEMIAGFHPFNYSNQLWVPRNNPTLIEERFALYERLDPQQAVESVQEWLASHPDFGKPALAAST